MPALAYVGFDRYSQAFQDLSQRDQVFIHRLATGGYGFQIILRKGLIAGYGIYVSPGNPEGLDQAKRTIQLLIHQVRGIMPELHQLAA